jgi:hypothetical protein
LQQRRRAVQEEAQLHQKVANARVVVFLVAAALAWLILGPVKLSVGWLGLPFLMFVVLLFAHQRVSRQWVRARRAVVFYERGLARLEDRWAGHGEAGNRFLDEAHPYALDLDLFGKGSLFELLSTARTHAGEDVLAGWLRAPGTPAELRERQAAVVDLRPRLDLREELALLGADIPSGVDLQGLAAWGASPPVLVSAALRWTALALSLLALVALVGWLLPEALPFSDFFDRYGRPLFLFILLGEGAFAWGLRRRVQHVIADVERRGHDLVLFSGVLACIERETFQAPSLVQLRAALETAGIPPSRRIAQLLNRIDWLNSRRNLFFAPLGAILMWGTQLAFRIELWRATTGPAIVHWLAAVGEFEALCSLAAYTYENPNDPFPEIVEGGPLFDGEGLGHPLLPRARCVRNDVHLGEVRLLVVSGSNMSGKSTLLRTVGVNAVLALAGAPVRATRLRLSQLAVGATLRIQDSLMAGRSRFYAEITRVRQLVDLARRQPPLLFLLDEIFHGTNSHDRRQGAQAVVQNLLNLGAIGLVTTHDLALTHIVELLGPRAANVHFEDQFEDGAIHFDYRMRPGVVTKSNALALMRAVGLEV